jgi:proteasome lid subunit RPN8/RPN11
MDILGHVLDDVMAHARQEAPRECCGILIGSAATISESARARNLAEGTTRFLIDPQDHVSALRRVRRTGLDVVGFYHSHPQSRAYPSETDVAESGYAGMMHLIVGVADGAPEARLFVIAGPTIEEVPLLVRTADSDQPEKT